MAEMNKNSAELLQQMIDIKKDTRTAISNKGVTVVGGMITYPDAINRIKNQTIVVEGGNIDYTQAGWTKGESDYQNALYAMVSKEDLKYTKELKEIWDYRWNLTDKAQGAHKGAYAFSSDYKLVIAPKISGIKNVEHMFDNCFALRYVPELDLSELSGIDNPNINASTTEMFSNCYSLKYITSIKGMENVTVANNMFSNCYSLTEAPQMNTTNVTHMGNIFGGCVSLKTIPILDMGNVVMQSSDINLGLEQSVENLGGFRNLKYSISLRNQVNLTHESLLNVVNTIATLTTETSYLRLGPQNLAKLSSDEIAIATRKGWNVVS